eukprot:TRINITY_DN13182_c0_g4_i1.p1 TRINITY_DN13182_c0_g4~~TRINITY_DN13182_c0_g4_i1.p1  ORF type:complete len:185 (+),score=40.11 TRINITY_DN13182_c0_g4_i1:48-602(+)
MCIRDRCYILKQIIANHSMKKELPERKVFNPPAVISMFVSFAIFAVLNFTLFNDMKITFISPLARYIIGLVLVIGAVVVAKTSMWYVKKAYTTRSLIKTGIFAWVRHPVYTAYGFCASLGVALILGRTIGLLFPVAAYFVFTLYIIPKEEKTLVEEFGDEYVRYREEVGAFFPKIFGNKNKEKR